MQSVSAAATPKVAPTSRPPLPTPDERLRLGLLRLGGVQDLSHGTEAVPLAMGTSADMIAAASLAVIDEAVEVLEAPESYLQERCHSTLPSSSNAGLTQRPLKDNCEAAI